MNEKDEALRKRLYEETKKRRYSATADCYIITILLVTIATLSVLANKYLITHVMHGAESRHEKIDYCLDSIFMLSIMALIFTWRRHFNHFKKRFCPPSVG